MRTLWLIVLACFVAVGAGCASPGKTASAQRATSGEERAVREAMDGFFAAMNSLLDGDVAPMEAVWSMRDDITYISPSEQFYTGRSAVMSSWRFQADQRFGGSISPIETHMFLNRGDALAVVQSRARGPGERIGGGTREVDIWTTAVLRKEHGAWKMVSLVPQPIRGFPVQH